MAPSLEIYWDFSSPFAYLGTTQAKAVAERTGAELVWRPMLLGAVFKAIGQVDVPLMAWSDDDWQSAIESPVKNVLRA